MALCSVNCIYLDCNYRPRTFNDLGTLYSCDVVTIHPSGGNTTISDVSHNHVGDNGNGDVEALIFLVDIDFTPFRIEEFFPNLVYLSLRNRKTSTLKRESLLGLTHLRQLDFGGNGLRIVEPNLFEGNPDIQRVYFENNRIRHVAFNVFDNLESLETLYMDDNDCIKENANVAGDIDLLKFHILVNCPPTIDMLEDRIVNGSLLKSIVTALIDEKIEPIVERMDEIERTQHDLIERVEDLEQNRYSF